MVIAAIGTVLAAGYLLWLYQRTAFGNPPAEFSGRHDGHDASWPRRALAERRRQRPMPTIDDDHATPTSTT